MMTAELMREPEDLSLLLWRLLGTQNAQDMFLPPLVLINLLKGRFDSLYCLVMQAAVNANTNHLLPWERATGGWYNPENGASHTFGLSGRWPGGIDWLNERFNASDRATQQLISQYGRLRENQPADRIAVYAASEPLVALFLGLCYAAEMRSSANLAWLRVVAASQRGRWEALLASDLYGDLKF